MAPLSIWFLQFLVLGSYGAHHNEVVMSSSEANSFVREGRSWFRRNLKHECYQEGCRFEEVTEVIQNKDVAKEYYYTYTCTKFGRNCKVPCKYREKCSFGDWGSWEGDIQAETPGCYKQMRTKPFKYPLQTQMRRFSCRGLNTECKLPPVQTRELCVCRKANCELGSWGNWTGDIEMLSCGTQMRSRPYVSTWSLMQAIDSCKGIQISCPPPEQDFRKMCSCPKAECTLANWGEWEGIPEEGTCAKQKRRRTYIKTILYEERTEKCPNVTQECPTSHVENRTMCSCGYVKCSPGNWSDWEPRDFEHAKCGQKQTRRKKNALTWAYLPHQDKCPSLPQKCPNDVFENRTRCKCLYRDSCDLQAWSAWDKPLNEEGCKMQTRTRSYVYPLKQAIQEDCNNLQTSCVTEPKEIRNYCNCTYVECTLAADWSNWTSPILNVGRCGEERRIRGYTAVKNFTFGENCDDLVTSCPADQEETRTTCKCPYVTCNVSDWNPWKGALPTDGCAQQMRNKNMTTKHHTKIQLQNCGGLQTRCPPIPPDTRQWCNCSFREDCELMDWSDWSGKVPVGGCAVQMRTRDYNNSLDWIERGTCDGLESCLTIREETRTKCLCNQIICQWGNWTRTSFNPQTNCYEETRVKNISRGFSVVEQLGSCDKIPIECSDSVTERREDCVTGGGSHVTHAHTNPPPKTIPSTTTQAPTTGYQPATYVSIGCFADSKKKPRPLPMMIANMRGNIDWHDLTKVVQACAEKAREKRYLQDFECNLEKISTRTFFRRRAKLSESVGRVQFVVFEKNYKYEYFSVQFYGECWSGPDAGKTFARDGESDKCYQGIGLESTNAVYRIENLPACSSELNFKASVTTGKVNDHTWCAGDTAKYQWIAVDFEGERKITGVGTQGGSKESWVTLYTLEWSEEGESWKTYQEDGYEKIFSGNSDRFTLETRWLKHPVNAGFLRFRPKSWTSTHVCMKIKIYGCAI